MSETYNARQQTATQTDINQTVSPMTFTGTGEWERTADTDSNGSHTYALYLIGVGPRPDSAAG